MSLHHVSNTSHYLLLTPFPTLIANLNCTSITNFLIDSIYSAFNPHVPSSLFAFFLISSTFLKAASCSSDTHRCRFSSCIDWDAQGMMQPSKTQRFPRHTVAGKVPRGHNDLLGKFPKGHRWCPMRSHAYLLHVKAIALCIHAQMHCTTV